MRRISSRWTWWYKKGVPILWFGFLGRCTFVVIVAALNQQVPAPVVLFPVGEAILVYFLMRCFIFPLMDEVYLSDDQVIVRKDGEEDSFPITNIVNVNTS